MTKRPQFPRILITGANGRLGPLLRGAYARSAPACGSVRFAARSGAADQTLDADAVPGTLPEADMVVALWGATSGRPEQLARNTQLVGATLNVARACRAPRVLHLSSAGVYGPGVDLAESDPVHPPAPYGRSKLDMEHEVARQATSAIAQCCLRLANVVGADSLAPALKAAPDQPVTLTRFEDGHGPLRSYIAPAHLLEIILALAALPAKDLPDILNVAASDPVGMDALARAAGRHITWKPATANDRQTVTLSTARLAALLPDLRLARSAGDMVRDWQSAEAAA